MVLNRSELRAIEEAEMEEIEKRNRINIEAEEEIRLSTCFVEFLNDHQLFDSLFVGDNSINDLLAVDGATDLVKVYVAFPTKIQEKNIDRFAFLVLFMQISRTSLRINSENIPTRH